MALLSEAYAAVSTPKYFSNIFDELPIQPAIRYDIGKKTSSPSRWGFLPTHKREVSTKDQRVMEKKMEKQRGDVVESDVRVWGEGGQGWNATTLTPRSKVKIKGQIFHFSINPR